MAIEDSKETFWYSSQNATCPPLSGVEAFTNFLIAKRRQVESLWIPIYSFLDLIWPGIEPEFTVSVVDALFTRPLIFLLLVICVFFFCFRNARKYKRYLVSDNLFPFKCSRINMKMLRWPFTLTPMASTHKIGLVMRWKCECAIVNKKFIFTDFQCNLATNVLLFCYIFGFFIPVFKVLTNRWICFWYAMSVLKWYLYVPLQDFFSTQQLA